MQKQLYLTDTYLTEVASAVLRAGESETGPWVALADNIFHPQGGGQPNDRGTVNGFAAQPRKDSHGQVLLDLECGGDAAPVTGDTVTAMVDAELRRLHAALHTAGHLIDALARQQGLQHVANSHFPGQARVEFLLDGREVDRDKLAEVLLEGVNEAITSDLSVISGESGNQRSITIDGLGTDLCGGTHVPHLGALKDVTIRSIKAKSGRLRIGYDAAHSG